MKTQNAELSTAEIAPIVHPDQPSSSDRLPLQVTTSSSRARLAATYNSERSRCMASACSS
ncbi:hypothetical protein [Nocardia sp. NBC_01009]|uniref:hypothetical protein n=1 Tax=Nocardia sp. NBC_01009 TaxID=2975996 RepID=UPI00386D43BC|nr:hypothetical protein OHA42_13965 [Nocardia sp. NBC_01009]